MLAPDISLLFTESGSENSFALVVLILVMQFFRPLPDLGSQQVDLPHP